MYIRSVFLILALLFAFPAPTFAQTSTQITPETPAVTVFVRVNVVPMDRERVLRGQTVIVEDGVIRAIGPRLSVPPRARVVDGQGTAFLAPGLADMHNHIDSRQDLAVQLAKGVTTMLNMGEARNSFVGRTRAAVERGDIPGPRIFAALAVDGSPQYGHLVVATPEDARATVRVAKANGYDFIKLYNNLSADSFAALAVEARAQKIALVGHGIGAVGLAKQLEAGQALVAHAEEFFYTYFPSPPEDHPTAAPDLAAIPAAAALVRQHGAYVIADPVTYGTIAQQWGRPDVVQQYLQRPEAQYLAPRYRVSWPEQGYVRRSGSLDERVVFLKRFLLALNEAGVPLMSGTDAPDIPGLVPGFALHRNLQALTEAGLSRYDALSTATRVPGEFIQREKPGTLAFGTVSVGSRADLVLIEGNPLDDLSTLATPRGVMANGHWHSADELAALLDGTARAYRNASYDQ